MPVAMGNILSILSLQRVIEGFQGVRNIKDFAMHATASIEIGGGRWWIADRPWDLDLHDFKQLLRIFVTPRIG
jgi:hypothetical protein